MRSLVLGPGFLRSCDLRSVCHFRVLHKSMSIEKHRRANSLRYAFGPARQRLHLTEHHGEERMAKAPAKREPTEPSIGASVASKYLAGMPDEASGLEQKDAARGVGKKDR